jgi:hypothetical protein
MVSTRTLQWLEFSAVAVMACDAEVLPLHRESRRPALNPNSVESISPSSIEDMGSAGGLS